MPRPLAFASALVLAAALGAAAQEGPSVDLVVQAGRPLRIALDSRVRLRGVGQRVTGKLVEPVYAYDRVVIPAGTRVIGHVDKLERVPRGTRLRAILSGDFTPLHRVVLQFDSLLPAGGTAIPIRTVVKSATERVVVEARSAPRAKDGVVASAREEVADRAKAAVADAKRKIAAIKEPGRLQRLKNALVAGLPYHPQYLGAGTVFTAELVEPVPFGAARATEAAASGTIPAPESILRARLLTPLDSSGTPKGTSVRAVVTEPVFSADHRLVLPEGTTLAGEVTFAKPARRYHRNGQLRFLFETVQVTEQAEEAMRASLYSVQVGRGQRVAIDDEGGASITNSKARFVAPVLGALALAASLHGRADYDSDRIGSETQYGSFQTNAVGGFFGLGLLGAGVSQLSRPVAIVLGAVGVVRTTYGRVFGKGRDVSFPAETVIQVQLGPQPTSTK